MEHFRQHTTMFNGLFNTVCSDIVSQLFVFYKGTFFTRYHLRLKVLKDQAWVPHS